MNEQTMSDPTWVGACRAVTPDEMHQLGRRLAAVLRAGDVVVLDGELGAGKTTLTQGIGAGLGIRGPVASPTFVIARVHPSLVDGPPLVHVDAYRLGGAAELDDLDLDTTVDDAVTVVEWGAGLAHVLAADRLEIRIEVDRGATLGSAPDPTDVEDHQARRLAVAAYGERWASTEPTWLVTAHRTAESSRDVG